MKTHRLGRTARLVRSAVRLLVPLSPCLLVLSSASCAPKAPPTAGKAEVKPVAVTVAPAKAIAVRRTVSVSGTLHGYEDVLLAPKVDGRVLRVLKKEGEAVAPGEVLMELDPTSYALAVAQARPALQAELRKLKLDALPDTDAALEKVLDRVDAVAQARATFELAEKELARAEFESAKGVGSAQFLDTARTRVKVAKTGVDLAETEARVTLAHARRLRAVLDDAEENLRETQLRAPIPQDWPAWSAAVGVAANPLRYAVATRMVSDGEMIRQMPVTNAYRLVIAHILKLRVTVPERYTPDVLVGQAVDVRVEAYPGKVFSGVVARVNPTVDTTNRTFVAEIEVPNLGLKLRVGGFATAEILTRTDAAVLTVPPESLVAFAGVTKVFVADGEVARAVEVSVGARERDWVEVRGELKPGAKVITSGQSQLVDGAAIRIR